MHYITRSHGLQEPRRTPSHHAADALPSGMQAMTPGTVPCVVSEGHDTAGLSPVSWRENAKVMYENLAFGENTLALRLENVSLREPLSDGFAANFKLNRI